MGRKGNKAGEINKGKVKNVKKGGGGEGREDDWRGKKLGRREC